MMIAFITMDSGLVPLIEGLCAQILYFRFEIMGGLRSHLLLFTIILLSNYYFGNRKGLLDHTQTKKYFWVVTARVFFQRFYSLMKLFSLNSLEQRDTDSLIATIPLWYLLFGVGYVSLRVWNGCVYNLWNVTQESYSVRVQVLGSHCAAWSTGSAPERNTLYSTRTTPRRPPGAPSRAPTPHLPAFWNLIS